MSSSPFFSVIMPSYLGDYKHAAQNRDAKIVRAINSVLEQDDFELIIVSDDCDKTVDIWRSEFYNEKRIRLLKIKPRKIKGKRNAGGAGIPRNAGLQNARGEYAIYLDIDDTYRKDYLRDLHLEMDGKDWYWFNDLSWNKNNERFELHHIDINTQGQCGTSNVCHKLEMMAWWSKSVTYLHDWIFINTLKSISSDYKFLDVAGYEICHVPNLLDV